MPKQTFLSADEENSFITCKPMVVCTFGGCVCEHPPSNSKSFLHAGGLLQEMDSEDESYILAEINHIGFGGIFGFCRNHTTLLVE